MPDQIEFQEETAPQIDFLSDEDALQAGFKETGQALNLVNRDLELGALAAPEPRPPQMPVPPTLAGVGQVPVAPPEMARRIIGAPFRALGTVGAGLARSARDVMSPTTFLPEEEQARLRPFVIDTRGGEIRPMTPAERQEREPIQVGRPLFTAPRTQLQPEGNDITRIAEEWSSPEGIAMLAAGNAGRLLGYAVLASMVPGLIDDAKTIASSTASPEDKRDRINNLFLLGGMIAGHGVRGRPEAPFEQEEMAVPPPITLTGGEIPGMPRGFSPLRAVAGPERLGPPIPPARVRSMEEAQANVPGGGVVVTPAESRVSAAQEVRAKNADTIQKILRLFPSLQGNRSRAREIGKAAWGDQWPEQPVPKPSEPVPAAQPTSPPLSPSQVPQTPAEAAPATPSPVPEAPEKIVSAAFKTPEGAVETGANHPSILKRLGYKGFETPESRNAPNFGFVTDKGRFITREEAGPIAKTSGQNLKDFEADEPVHSNEVESPVEPGVPLGDVPQRIEDTVIAGKTLGEWEAIRDASQLPKGNARAELARWLAVPNQPSRILQALGNKRRTREIHAPPAAAVTPVSLALEEQRKAGWDPKWPFVPADFQNKSFRDAIESDPNVSAEEKDRMFAAAEKLLGGKIERTPPQSQAPPATVAAPEPPAPPTPPTAPVGAAHPIDTMLEREFGIKRKGTVSEDGKTYRTPPITRAQYESLWQRVEESNLPWGVSGFDKAGNKVIGEFTRKRTPAEKKIAELEGNIGFIEAAIESDPRQREAGLKSIAEKRAQIEQLKKTGGRKITSAAVRLGSEMATGRTHIEASTALRDRLGIGEDDPRLAQIEEGFIDDQGNWVEPNEAFDLGRAAGQVAEEGEKGLGLHSGDLIEETLPPKPPSAAPAPPATPVEAPAVVQKQVEWVKTPSVSKGGKPHFWNAYLGDRHLRVTWNRLREGWDVTDAKKADKVIWRGTNEAEARNFARMELQAGPAPRALPETAAGERALAQQIDRAGEKAQQLAKGKPSMGPGAAAAAEFEPGVQSPDPAVYGMSAGNRWFNERVREYQNMVEGFAQLFQGRGGSKKRIIQSLNAARTLPAILGNQAGNSFRLRLKNVLEQRAVTALMQALKMSGEGLEEDDLARLQEDPKFKDYVGDPQGYIRVNAIDLQTYGEQQLAKGNRLEAQAAFDLSGAMRYARDHYADLKPTAELAKRVLDAQLKSEEVRGIDTDYERWYVPQRHDLDLLPAAHRPIVLAASKGVGPSSQFRKPKFYEDYASAIQAGLIPRSLAIADLIEHRVRTGETLAANKALFESLKRARDPIDRRQIIMDISKRKIRRPDGTVDVREAVPLEYAPYEVMPGMRVAVHKGYERMLRALTGTGATAESAGIAAAQSVAAFEKHLGLALDTFHFVRTLATELATTGRLSLLSRLQKGTSLLEYDLGDLNRAVQEGKITQATVDWILKPQQWNIHGRDVMMTPRAVINYGIKAGLNLGRIADAIYKDWIRDLPFLGRINKFVFDKVTRSAMTHGFLTKFRSIAAQHPEWTADQVARNVASDINVLFGNLQKESWIRSPSLNAVANVLFLAPNWVQSRIRSEVRGARQIGYGLYEAARGYEKGGEISHIPRIGTAGQVVGTGLLGSFMIAQLVNLITRGHLTFQNDEPEHKLDAYIPDPYGHGFFFSPLAMFAEIAHDIIRYSYTKPDALSVADQIIKNKLGNLGRMVWTLASHRDPFTDQKIIGTPQVLGSAFSQAIPVPIIFSGGVRAGIAKMAPGVARDITGSDVERQALSSFGVKVEPAGSAQSEVRRMVDRWKMTQEPKLQADVNRRLKEDFRGEYTDLRQALTRGEPAQAQRAYEKLREEGKTPKQIRQTIRHPHPFAGSRVLEHRFRDSLTPAEQKIYHEALNEREIVAREFDRMLENKPQLTE